MPLSENEQRQFEAIERALYADDPKFASALRSVDPKIHARRRLVLGVLAVLLGLAVLLAGVIASFWYVGVIGFLIMLAGATQGVTAVRRLTGFGGPTAPTALPPNVAPLRARGRGRKGRRKKNTARPEAGTGGGPFSRLEARWRRRTGDDDGYRG